MAKSSRALAKSSGNVPSALLSRMSKDKGKGVSNKQEDNLVPLMYVVQALSPVALKKNAAYIEGTEAGDLWLRNSSDPIAKGEEGILFQPCHFYKEWVEWMPDRGGFVGRHDEMPADAKKIEDPKNPNRVKFRRKNGNSVVETRYHVGFVLERGAPMPYVIPFSSSGHSASRAWMFQMNTKTMPDGDGVAPSFATVYRLKTKHRQNDDGEWYVIEAMFEDWVQDVKEYERGKALNAAFEKGEKRAAVDDTDEARI